MLPTLPTFPHHHCPSDTHTHNPISSSEMSRPPRDHSQTEQQGTRRQGDDSYIEVRQYILKGGNESQEQEKEKDTPIPTI